jgi:hypothetical protein
MKTMPLEEVLRLATKGPLIPSSDPARYPAIIAESGTWVAKTDCSINSPSWAVDEPVTEANAALLAHFYNHGPELVRAVADLINANEALHATLKMDSRDNLTLLEARILLAKASTVQMP